MIRPLIAASILIAGFSSSAFSGVPTNVALEANGGVATSSSEIASSFPTRSVIDGDRRAQNWGAGGGWNDATPDQFPDWVRIDFNGIRKIDEIDVYTLRDDFWTATDPTLTTTFAAYGIQDFEVQYWDGTKFVCVPGGHVQNNNKVWRQFRFNAIATRTIRIYVTRALFSYSRIVEIEAYEPERKNVALSSNGATTAASTTISSGFPTSAVNDGEILGLNWGNGGGWNDGTPDTYPDWVEVDFSDAKTIDQIDVYTLRDDFWIPGTITPETTFAGYGIRDFDVQYKVAESTFNTVVGGHVTGNNKVWRQFLFSPITTTAIRVRVSGAPTYSRVVEIAAYEAPQPPTVLMVACTAAPTQTCAKIFRSDGTTPEVLLSASPASAFTLNKSGTVGSMGSSQAQYFYLFSAKSATDPLTGSTWVPYVHVLDLNAATLVGEVTSPFPEYTVFNTFFSVIRNSAGDTIPFLGAGAHYLGTYAAGHPVWSTLCVFDTAYIGQSGAGCGPGFKPYHVGFTTASGDEGAVSGFRHNGGWVDDIDGDGWDDIHLPFLSYILSLSGRTGEQLSLKHFDVAAQTEPNSPPYFHSGRFYGAFTSFNDPNTGEKSVLITAGDAVGQFGDYFCNVSRYVANFKWTADVPTWSHYYSFPYTLFNPPYDSINNYSRLGNDLHGCIHRFSDSVYWAGQAPIALYSVWQNQDPAPVCQQLLLEREAGASDNGYPDCFIPQVLAKQGRWMVSVINPFTGQIMNNWGNAYMWGRIKSFMPGQPDVLVAEVFHQDSGLVRFDQQGHVPEEIAFLTLNADYTFNVLGSVLLPQSQPELAIDPADTSGYKTAGTGATWQGIPELVVQDIDGDGFNDFKLKNGTWIGYANGGFVIKNP